MASVWYTGAQNRRQITSADWKTRGITGDSYEWNQVNGYSISQSRFTTEQLALLSSLADFQLTPTDGPRPGATAEETGGSGITLDEFKAALMVYMSSYLAENPFAIALTQAQYDAITPVPGRVYAIVPG